MTQENLTEKTLGFNEEPKKKSNKAKWITAGVLAGALAIGGYGVYLNHKVVEGLSGNSPNYTKFDDYMLKNFNKITRSIDK
tara:strand:- start:309 stop:551 length:243 start_codon:yes stop_codon:yes gene_type:complete